MALQVLSEEQKATCVNLGCALVIAEVAQNYESIEVELVASSLLDALGAERGTECVVVSRVSESAFDEMLSQWWVPTFPPGMIHEGEEPAYRIATLVEKARAKLAWEYCCQVVGVNRPPTTEAPQVVTDTSLYAQVAGQQQLLEAQTATMPLMQQAQAMMQHQLHQAQLAAANSNQGAQTPTAQLAPPAASTRRIKLKELVDEFNEDECGLLSEVELARCYAVYESVFGKDERPEEEEELTHEQLSALCFLLKQGSITVNFNIFGPHGHRTIRRVKLQGQFFSQDGTLHRVELLGPATFEMWLASWHVFSHGLLMLEAVELGRLTAYRKYQERMHRRYGAALWPLQFQVEKRTRDELFPRIKRDGYADYLKEKAAVEQAGHEWNKNMHPFDPEKPWDYVFWKVMHESSSSWWMQQFELPALRIPTTHKRVSDFVEGDAPISNASGSQRSTTAIADPFGHSYPPPPVAHGAGRPPKKPRTSYNVGTDGLHKITRTGVPICEEYNKGNCTATNQGAWCAKNPNEMHICSRCLQSRHNASQNLCTVTAPEPKRAAYQSGKGKGGKKGKGKGKGKKGNWWGY